MAGWMLDAGWMLGAVAPSTQPLSEARCAQRQRTAPSN
jgi:hypothetical protein